MGKQDDKIAGLIEAHRILSRLAAELGRLRWWEVGFAKSHQLSALVKLSERIYDDIERRRDLDQDLFRYRNDLDNPSQITDGRNR